MPSAGSALPAFVRRDPEVLARALGLRPPVPVGRHLDGPMCPFRCVWPHLLISRPPSLPAADLIDRPCQVGVILARAYPLDSPDVAASGYPAHPALISLVEAHRVASASSKFSRSVRPEDARDGTWSPSARQWRWSAGDSGSRRHIRVPRTDRGRPAESTWEWRLLQMSDPWPLRLAGWMKRIPEANKPATPVASAIMLAIRPPSDLPPMTRRAGPRRSTVRHRSTARRAIGRSACQRLAARPCKGIRSAARKPSAARPSAKKVIKACPSARRRHAPGYRQSGGSAPSAETRHFVHQVERMMRRGKKKLGIEGNRLQVVKSTPTSDRQRLYRSTPNKSAACSADCSVQWPRDDDPSIDRRSTRVLIRNRRCLM